MTCSPTLAASLIGNKGVQRVRICQHTPLVLDPQEKLDAQDKQYTNKCFTNFYIARVASTDDIRKMATYR